jgi:hypothetical protein
VIRRVAIAAAALIPFVGLLVACGDSDSRKRARAELVDQLVEGGLERGVADCVVEAFFDARNDRELRDFFDREELTDDERSEFAQLGKLCIEG